MKRLLTVFVILMLVSSVMPIMADGDAPFPTKEWAVSTPEEQGISSKDLLALLTPFTQENFHFDSLVVVRNGYIIAEAYNTPYGPENTHQLLSASKMVTAMAVGIALKEGLIKSLDETMISFFPNRQIQNLDDRKKAITVRHMLTFSDGLACDDMFVPAMQHTLTGLLQSADMIQATLDLPMAAEPGTTWHYCNSVTYLLSAIVGKVTGMSTLDYLDQKLFAPLGISKPTWLMHQGIPMGYVGLLLNTRDMAKIGHLLMQKGKWDDLQILDADYVKALTGPSIQTPWPGAPYGYQMWTTDDYSWASAIGHGGQFIALIPKNGLVIALTGTMTESTRVGIQSYPLLLGAAAIKASDTPLAADEESDSALKSYLDAFAKPTPESVPPLSDLAKRISGVTYNLASADLFYPGPVSRVMSDKVYLDPTMSSKAFKLAFEGGDTATFSVTFADDKTLDIAVGLDNVYRASPWLMGTMAAKGWWLTPDTFRISLRPLGANRLYQVDISFISSVVNVITYETVDGEALAIQGMAAQ